MRLNVVNKTARNNQIESFAPLQMDVQAELQAEIMDLRANMGTKRVLGQMPEFKEIRMKALELGFWVCSCMVCEDPLKDLTDFVTTGGVLTGKCKDCRNKDWRDWYHGTTSETQEAREQRTMDSNEHVGSIETSEPHYKTEDEVMKNFLVPVLSQVFEFIVMPEFRRADAVVKCPNGKYIQIQLKTDGAFHKDGTPKPDNSTRKKCDVGQAMFTFKSKYEMLVISIKSRLVNGELKRYIWVEHGSKITTSALGEHPDGTLGPQKIPQVDIEGLIDAIREEIAREENHVYFIDAWFHVYSEKHFKEVANIQALQTVYNVDVPRQNQQDFDCFFDQRRIQVKTYTVKSGEAGLSHTKNGRAGQPYDSKDEIDAFCIDCIIRLQTVNGIQYFMLYCEIPMDVLIKNKMVIHDNKGGITTLSVHPGIYEEMLIGRTKNTTSKTSWLDDYPFKHVRLYEHTPENPQVHKLTKENLEKVAQDISKPEAAPQCMFE